jgi:hypothetical protein
MLSTIIEQLTSFGSKQFVVGAFVPVLVFAFLNGLVLYLESPAFERWAARLASLDATFEGFVILIALAVVAYVLWGLTTFLGDVLEGRRLPSRWPFSAAAEFQQRRLETLHGQYLRARNERAAILDRRPAWRQQLSDAGVVGLAAGANAYDAEGGAAAAALATLRAARLSAREIATADLAAAVDGFAAVLRANDLRIRQADGSSPLSDDHRDLLTLVDYAADRWGAQEVALASELQRRFGVGVAAPTAYGNVAAALRSYGLTRYGLNLPTVWTRLQSLFKADDPYLATLQAARSQLDFSVLACWLALASTATWALVLPFVGSSPLRLVIVLALGPILARLAYLAAVENYVTFAEVVRAGVDLHRFRVFDALSLPRPRTLRDERRLWDALRKATDFGQESIDLSYTTPKDDKA